MINVEVEKTQNENSIGLIRRFTKRVQGSGVLPRVRSIRYFKRTPSKTFRKKRALKSIGKREALEELIKLGKAPEKPLRGGQRR